ncbi:OmpA family protein [Gemmobacter denitrificans]|uniref:OmpA family protein n=1 Tax=Gemmobacter denitrificans TaxID=3123040 RepID=A0ABU8BWR7_9RHOB
MLTTTAFLGGAVASIVVAWTAAMVIENRSEALVRSRLLAEGITWPSIRATGLQLRLYGTAPNEAARFRVVNLAGSVIDAARVRDRMEVAPVKAIEAPRFSVEMLRYPDGVSLIGLLPAAVVTDPNAPAPPEPDKALAAEIAAIAGSVPVSDMLETAAYPAPEGWEAALEFATAALKLLPRAKISVSADKVAITAISDSDAQKRRLEGEIAKLKPPGLATEISISAPRPVLTPFTLRFLKDANGARFDACSADTDAARDRILQAGAAAGVQGSVICTVGMGTPTPSWADATVAGITAINTLGGGSITFSDADVTLQAEAGVSQALFDRVVGELQTALPATFSLKSSRPSTDAAQAGPAEFTATLAEDGRAELRGRVTDDLLKSAVDSFARARFGADKVYTATRFDEELPDGWAVRVLAGLEALSILHHGALTVRADTVSVSGITGRQDGRARVAQILSDKLGQGQPFKVDIRYDEAFDPFAALPSPQECVADLNAIVAKSKITFAPGSAEITSDANATMVALTDVLKSCPALKLEIAGHTDAQGSTEGNLALSQARAEAVLLSLQGRGAPVGGILAKGYGEGAPVADNGTDEGREANRRIEFTLIGAPAPSPTETPAEDAEAPAAGAAAAPVDDSPSIAPQKMTLRPKPRPKRN